MVDLTKYYSHPDKQIQIHVNGVIKRIEALTNIDNIDLANITKVAGIFHDVGKLNPNFQSKIRRQSKSHLAYSNHSYLSAISFLSYAKNANYEKKYIPIIFAIIAHHHGNLPDFEDIMNSDECSRLLSFIEENSNLPVAEFIKSYIADTEDFAVSLREAEYYCDFQGLYNRYYTGKNKPPDTDCIDFFLKTRFAFASVILADKSDASNYQTQKTAVYSQYNVRLDGYIQESFSNSDTGLNLIRTGMREDSTRKLEKEIEKGSRVFSLASPTGSGKTIMLLSLAGKILNVKDDLRIIYALPYLSITEQVENVCRSIFNDKEDYICRIDSNSENKDFEKIQSKLDNGDADAIKESTAELIAYRFAEDTFDYPFIITTFVRFFETLVSNKNATLLKLPNFANAIFLIDEIQSIPPRLYGFFVALLSDFCKKFNSYAIISTATMPDFKLPERDNLSEIFQNYEQPIELLSPEYFKEPVFNRYCVNNILPEPVIIDDIVDMIKNEQSSILVILNTIQDTKDLFEKLKECINAEVILINTHFTLNDRKEKIERCKELLKNGKRVILISTQLIEAGVDIDFPVVYRDFCPIPNIIQSAGRCNRNGANKMGKVVIFELFKKDKSRSALVYKDKYLLDLARKEIQKSEIEESKLINLQRSFFKDIRENTLFGTHYGKRFKNGEIDFIKMIKERAFAEIGKFQLIDDIDYGEERRYYIAKDEKDGKFERLTVLYSELKQIDFRDFQAKKLKNIEIENQFKKMSGNVVKVRLKSDDSPPLAGDECLGLLKLSPKDYNEDTGIRLTSENQIL